MLMLSWPSRWRYDILRALDYFRAARSPYDTRMDDALEVLAKKRRADGRWPLQAKHPGRVHFDMEKAGEATDIIRGFIRTYEMYESPYKGFSHDVVSHRMPGGAFPSSFEQAEKGGFLDLMPDILKGMAYGNRIIKYFDVTPGSQITWTTWAGIVQRVRKEGGEPGVRKLFHALERYFQAEERMEALSPAEESILLGLYARATDDLKNLLLGRLGPLPFGWPKDWVYRSAFGEEWRERVAADRLESSPLSHLPEEDLGRARETMEADEPAGRRLNFLLQEMHREVNTLGSKANDAEIGYLVVGIKEELEKIREQVQNIE